MAYTDLRDFLTRLEADGELIRITAPVSAHLEITEITDRVSKGPAGQNKALLFENVEGSTMPVLINAFGSARRMALALGVDDLEELRHNLGAGDRSQAAAGHGRDGQARTEMLGVLRSIGFGPSMTRRAPCQDSRHQRESIARHAADPQVLAGRRRQVHHAAAGHHARSGDRSAQRGHVPLAEVRRANAGDALAAAQGRRGTRARGPRPEKRPDPVCDCARRRSGADVVRVGAAAARHRRISAGRLAARQAGRVRQGDDAGHRSARQCGDRDRGLRRSERAPHGRAVRGSHRVLHAADLFPVFHVTAITHRRGAIYPTTIVGKPPMEDYWMGKATERLFLPLLQLFHGRDRGCEHARRRACSTTW